MEGSTAACHVETGRSGEIVNCFAGQQTCTNGYWGPCGGSGTVSSVDLRPIELAAAEEQKREQGGLETKAIIPGVPSVSAALCLSNPCNPYCIGIDVDAQNLTPMGGFTSVSILGTVKTPDQFPGGISGPKNAMSTFATSGPPAYVECTQAHPPADGKICSSDYCCANYRVGSANFTCQPWATVGGLNPVAVNNCVKATGVDLQLGLACNETLTGQVHVPACNRGTVAATSGTIMIAEYPGNPKYAGDLSGPPGGFCNNPGTPSAYCLLNLATKPIAAGKCIDVNVTIGSAAGSPAGITCTSGFSSGNRTMMINPPAPPLGYASSFTPAYTTVPEADQCNNYSFHPTNAQGGTCSQYGEQPPPPADVALYYEAKCAPGEGPRWNQLTYDSIVLPDSEVIFNVSTAPRVNNAPGAYTSPVQAADVKSDGTADPQLCAPNGATNPARCPKNLTTILGVAAASNDYLKLDVTLIARTALPIVKSWSISYSCVPRE